MEAWRPRSPDLSPSERNLLSTFRTKAVKAYTMSEIMERSERFPVKFPVDTGRLKTLKNKKNITAEQLTKNINSAYPFVHEHVLKLFVQFIEFKKHHGSAVEKKFYGTMELKTFVERLLNERTVMFMGKDDKYVLLNGETGSKNWESIGTDNESPPLTLQNCLSYDEIKLSAFLYVSSYTYFVNKGDRKNKAVYSKDRADIEEEGVIAGMIGPRLKKQGVMDFQEIVCTPNQNKESNGYGGKPSVRKLFFDFFEEDNCLYETVVRNRKSNNSQNRYMDIKTPKGAIFDNKLYHKRLTIVFDCLLIEANSRAKEASKMAYVHVVGLGLGVWRASDHQEKVFMECFFNRINALSTKLASISDICFSYIDQESCGSYTSGDTIKIPNHPSKGIKIHISRRQPHEKLNDNGKLLVVSYAWDGNALPGNEYWSGKLGSSGDSAAASATQIAELHNPRINPLVCADNLRVVTSSGELVRLHRYLSGTRKRSGQVEESDEGSSDGTTASSSKKSKFKYLLDKVSSFTLYGIWNELPDALKNDEELQSHLPSLEHYNRPNDDTHIDGPPPPKYRCRVCRGQRTRADSITPLISIYNFYLFYIVYIAILIVYFKTSILKSF